MKIKNAIILAAGRGSRMRELTNDIPKCMLKIKNQTIIQRTIEVLKNKNINNIIVVTGYKSDILEKHLKEIDKNIKTKYNFVWDRTNSLVSMCLVCEHLKNTIVIDSDIYINNPDCIKNEIAYSGYSAVKATRLFEWQLLADKNNFIKKTETSGQYNDGLPIIDISYWLEKDSNIIFRHLLNFTQYGTKEDGNKFWDEIPLIDFLHQFKLKRYDINEDDAMEFDTPEEFEKVRKIVCLAD